MPAAQNLGICGNVLGLSPIPDRRPHASGVEHLKQRFVYGFGPFPEIGNFHPFRAHEPALVVRRPSLSPSPECFLCSSAGHPSGDNPQTSDPSPLIRGVAAADLPSFRDGRFEVIVPQMPKCRSERQLEYPLPNIISRPATHSVGSFTGRTKGIGGRAPKMTPTYMLDNINDSYIVVLSYSL